MVFGLLKKIFGTTNERTLRAIWPLVEKIGSLDAGLRALSDQGLGSLSADYRQRVDNGEPLGSVLPEAFALVRETSRRVLGMRHFDVQIIGGMVLHEGKIAEMKTGEGKTLCATLPVYLNALTGRGVHVVTVNDYLARRDAEWMGRIYSFLGLRTGVVVHGISNEQRRDAYNSEITYGQNNEFGFDYLRDNMKVERTEKVQRKHYYAIVDEVDSILVDEARTPLIISGPSEDSTDHYKLADGMVRKLREEEDYSIELKNKQVSLTEDGVRHVEKLLSLDNLYDPKNIELVHHVNQALKAHVIMKRDIDYMVTAGQVVIVDEFTGRQMPGRRWSDGLHQAVEAKEGVKIASESQTLATITFQNYFRMYEKLSGMTGTADTEAEEFKKIYNLDVVIIPTNKPMLRNDYPDVVYSGESAKYNAVCEEIAELREKGQPVLVGTASIEKSEMISAMLKKRGVAHHVLNAKHHEREAEIVAQAGRRGAVTISTNMAGRGTDILLGGNPESLAATDVGTRDAQDLEYQEALEHYRKQCAQEKQEVLEAGGLHILGTERHESRRIDNQLRGRSGRQGDPGSSRFYISLQDDLMKRFGGERMQAIMARVGLRDDDAIEGRLVAGSIERAQKKVEGFNFDRRKHLLDYDDVMNKQREVVYAWRDKILNQEDPRSDMEVLIGDVIEELILTRVDEKTPPSDWDFPGVFEAYNRIFGFQLSADEYMSGKASVGKDIAQETFEFLKDKAINKYASRRQSVGDARMAHFERIVSLQSIDHHWIDHLAGIDHLKEGIGLRGYGQKNPLHEYQREAFSLFQSLMGAIKVSIAQHVFLVELPTEDDIRELERREMESQKARESLAKGVHAEVAPPAVEPEPEVLIGNRKQRRMQEQHRPAHATGAATPSRNKRKDVHKPVKQGKR